MPTANLALDIPVVGLAGVTYAQKVNDALQLIDNAAPVYLGNKGVSAGASDNTNALRDALAAKNYQGRFILPEGTIRYSGRLGIPKRTPVDGFTPGLLVGGGGRGKTILQYEGSSDFAVTMNDGTGDADGIVNGVHFHDMSCKFTNGPGFFELVDSTNFCGIERVNIHGYGTVAGEGVRMRGQTSCVCHNALRSVAFRNLRAGARLSGFANSNLLSGGWIGIVDTGLDLAAVAPDTKGGEGNTVLRYEFNGSTVLGAKLRGADSNRFAFCTWDGPTTVFDIDAASDETMFVACNGLSGTTIDNSLTTHYVACPGVDYRFPRGWQVDRTIDSSAALARIRQRFAARPAAQAFQSADGTWSLGSVGGSDKFAIADDDGLTSSALFRFYLLASGHAGLGAPGSPPADADVLANTVAVYHDAAAAFLRFRVRQNDGSLKTASVGLV